MRRVPARPISSHAAPLRSEVHDLCDLRFRTLLPTSEWDKLPAAIRRRFSKRLAGGDTAVYAGVIDSMTSSRIGRVLAQVFRLIGAPLPIHMDTGVASVVTVTEDKTSGGQVWTRLYAHSSGFPQIIQSSKRFSGPTGLEEYIGFGIAMALRPKASETALTFESAGYFLRLGGWRVPLPAFVWPGYVSVTHEYVTEHSFRFTLNLVHPLFGAMIEQSGVFQEAKVQ
jgi:hypothetical protein